MRFENSKPKLKFFFFSIAKATKVLVKDIARKKLEQKSCGRSI